MQDKRKVWTLDQRLDRTTVNVPPSSWDYLIIRHKGKQAGLAARGAHCPLVIGMQDAFEISTNWRRGKVVSPASTGRARYPWHDDERLPTDWPLS